MTFHEILTNIILAIILASCYVVLPVFFAGVFMLDAILIIHAYITALLQSAYHAIVSRCIHWIMIPTVLLVLTTIYWIKRRRIEITSAASLCWVDLCAKSGTTKTVMMGHAVLPTCIRKMMYMARDYHMSFARTSIEVSNEESNSIGLVARVRTREQDRLRRCIDDLEALEAEDLPEPMTTENAMLLILTRLAATDGKGVVYYRILENLDPNGPAQLVERREHEALRPHGHYKKLYLSNINLFRTDEPDCAICYCPLEVGQAMVTHETCRRTFHTLCLNESFWREMLCPFDRENVVVRPDMSSTTPFLGLPINAGDEPEQIENHLPAGQILHDFERQLPEDEVRNEQQIGVVQVGNNGLIHLMHEDIMNEAPRVVRGAGIPGLIAQRNQVPRDQAPQNQAPRQDRRPVYIRPYQNNARGRGRARRVWR